MRRSAKPPVGQAAGRPSRRSAKPPEAGRTPDAVAGFAARADDEVRAGGPASAEGAPRLAADAPSPSDATMPEISTGEPRVKAGVSDGDAGGASGAGRSAAGWRSEAASMTARMPGVGIAWAPASTSESSDEGAGPSLAGETSCVDCQGCRWRPASPRCWSRGATSSASAGISTAVDSCSAVRARSPSSAAVISAIAASADAGRAAGCFAISVSMRA